MAVRRCIVAHVGCVLTRGEQSTVLGQTDDNRMEARILGMISAVISYGGVPEKE
jgi:hypothetical protein